MHYYGDDQYRYDVPRDGIYCGPNGFEVYHLGNHIGTAASIFDADRIYTEFETQWAYDSQ